MKHLIPLTILAAFFIFQPSFAQPQNDRDSVMIAGVVALNRESPKEVEQFFSKGEEIPKQNLGFGWAERFTGLTGVYIHIMARFYYYNDSLVSYSIAPEIPFDDRVQMPGTAALQNRYIQWYHPYYSTDTIKAKITDSVWGNRVVIKPFWFNENGMMHPLKEYEAEYGKKNLPHNVLAYMYPQLVLMYGWGTKFGLLDNRIAFNRLKNNLTENEIIAILFSINPVSRLTAVEYCIRNKLPLLNAPFIKNWIERIYKEVPQIMMPMGMDAEMMGSRDAVEYCVKYYRDK